VQINPAVPIMKDASEPAAFKVLLVDDGEPAIGQLHGELVRLGCTVLGTVDSAMEIIEAVQRLGPDVVIIGAESPSRDTLEHLAAMRESCPRPIVLFTDDAAPEQVQRALRAGVSSYVVDGLQAERLAPVIAVAIARFEAEAELRAELAAARGELAARKRIEKAKGILMQARGCSEEEAYRQLRRLAMDRGLKLVEVAERVIDAQSLLS
jgi:response regulator NasT